MSDVIEAVPTPAPASGLRRFWRHPVTQMFARIVFFLLVAGLIGYVLSLALPTPPKLKGMADQLTQPVGWAALRLMRSVVAILGAYWLMVWLFERRPLDELAPRPAPLHIAAGWLLGTLILLVSTGAIALAGGFAVLGTNADAPLLVPLIVLGLGAGITEEIMFRGVLFRVVEEAFGTWSAVVVSALFFGAVHLGNPNATWWSSLAIAIEAGFLLGIAFAATRSLWFVMAMHAAWNFTQGPLLGVAVSGIAVNGLVRSSPRGPDIISGGEFGAEASIITLVVCVALALYFTRRAAAAGRIIPPFWRRRGADGTVPPLRFPNAGRGQA